MCRITDLNETFTGLCPEGIALKVEADREFHFIEERRQAKELEVQLLSGRRLFIRTDDLSGRSEFSYNGRETLDGLPIMDTTGWRKIYRLEWETDGKPYCLILNSSSLSNFETYVRDLTFEGVALAAIWTKLSLSQHIVYQGPGLTYSRINFERYHGTK